MRHHNPNLKIVLEDIFANVWQTILMYPAASVSSSKQQS
jgi:hypothetical protein